MADNKLRHVIAMDLGGTQFRAVLADAHGTVVAQTSSATEPQAQALLAQIEACVHEWHLRVQSVHGELSVICIGLPGIVHPHTQQLKQAPNLVGIDMFDLRSKLQDATGIPVHLDNDVNLAALAEYHARRDESLSSLAFIAIGTGLGMGLILRGQLWQGHEGGAGELCNLGNSPHNAPQIAQLYQGRTTTVEDVVSGKGLAHVYAALGKLASDAPIGTDKPCFDHRRTPEIFEKASHKDSIAVNAIALLAQEAAYAIAQIEHLLNPQVYVLGGGIGALPSVRDAINSELRHTNIQVQSSRLCTQASKDRVSMSLGAGLTGALLQALANINSQP